MNTYTLYWTPAQQGYLMQQLPNLHYANAIWFEETGHFALVDELSPPEYNEGLEMCQNEAILGIKPGSNPGGSPNGCA
jgi:hypothetical protein